MIDWKVVKLESYVDLLAGFPFKSNFFSDNIDDVPLVKGENLHQQYIDWDNAKRWDKNEYAKLEKYHLKKNDIVIAMDRPWIDAGLKYSWIKESDPNALLVQRVARLRGKNGLDTKFLRYVIGSHHFSLYLKNIVTGVNVPHISGKQILDFNFILPPLPIQKKIASILSAYDELIENNNQRIKLLEEMAEEIHKEWFVRLRFPGHEHTPIYDGVPEGWEKKRIKDYGKIVTGKTPSKEVAENFDGPIPFIKTPDFEKGLFFLKTEETLSVKGADSQKSQYIPKDSISVSCIGTVGKVGISTSSSQTNQQINTIILKHLYSREYLYFSLVRLKPVIESYAATGATMANLSKGKFTDLKLEYPISNLLQKFHKLAFPMFEEIKTLSEKNQVLKETRDLLLPRLISGKLSVEHLLNEAEPAALAAEADNEYH